MDTKTLIGKCIYKMRIQKKMSQTELAIKMETSKEYISSVENGRKNITCNKIGEFSKALECTSEELFAEKLEL